MIHFPLIAVALMVLLSVPAFAQTSVLGLWCNAEGTNIQITAESITDFEHTLCLFDRPQPAARNMAAGMVCRSYRFADDGTPVETHAEHLDVTAALAADDELTIDYADGSGPSTFTRCEE